MPVSELAGRPAPRDILVNVPRLVAAYYTLAPDPGEPSHRVAFGTSGHRGSSLAHSFNEAHILAVTQAICEYRKAKGYNGPLFMGMDTHALSEPAWITALEVLAANDVAVMVDEKRSYTPTPVISHAILTYNAGRDSGLSDGIVITPSHNPPCDGGFKYNPPEGGPADTQVTGVIQDRANQLLETGLDGIKRMHLGRALASDSTTLYDFITPYVEDLANMVDMQAIADAKLKIGVDPLGGSGIYYWEPMEERYGLGLTVVNPVVDPAFAFMTVDHDGKIRMDCSSPYAMASLITHKDSYDIAFGNDPDYDRHGIVTRTGGLMNPNHFLSAAAWYLFQHRPDWPAHAAMGKTVVSSSMIDRVAEHLGRKLVEVPVGFKWFVDGLLTGTLGMGCEESAGASYLRKNGKVWTTDKDGPIMDLLAAEMTAKLGRDPSALYEELEDRFGGSLYKRIDAPASHKQKAVLKNLDPGVVTATDLAGEPIKVKLTKAPGNNADIGGLKVAAANGWFAARPSGTEEIYKIYAESFKDADHLQQILDQAQQMVADAFKAAGT